MCGNINCVRWTLPLEPKGLISYQQLCYFNIYTYRHIIITFNNISQCAECRPLVIKTRKWKIEKLSWRLWIEQWLKAGAASETLCQHSANVQSAVSWWDGGFLLCRRQILTPKIELVITSIFLMAVDQT